MTKEMLDAELVALKEEGYVFRIVGGANKKGDESNFVSIERLNESLEVEVCCVPYKPDIKIKREYADDEFEETSEGALYLKVVEQTGIKIFKPKKIFSRDFPNNRLEVRAQVHWKNIYQTDKYDDSGIRTTATSDGRIAPPIWIPISLLHEVACPQHQWIVDEIEKNIIKASEAEKW